MNRAYIRSEETRRKISLGNMGKTMSEEAKRKISEFHKGLKQSEATKQKLSLINKGKKLSETTKQRISEGCKKNGIGKWMIGRKHSEEQKQKMSKAQSGERGSNWQGGKSFEYYGVEFNRRLKEQIRKRDNHTCQECGFEQVLLKRKLHVHHIDYNKKNNSPENLIALCNSCHMQTNYGREDWTNYFNARKSKDSVCCRLS